MTYSKVYVHMDVFVDQSCLSLRASRQGAHLDFKLRQQACDDPVRLLFQLVMLCKCLGVHRDEGTSILWGANEKQPK